MKTIPVIEVLAGRVNPPLPQTLFSGRSRASAHFVEETDNEEKIAAVRRTDDCFGFVFAGTACRGGDVVVDIGHDTPAPTAKPTTSPTAEPTPEPTAEPTPDPTLRLFTQRSCLWAI